MSSVEETSCISMVPFCTSCGIPDNVKLVDILFEDIWDHHITVTLTPIWECQTCIKRFSGRTPEGENFIGRHPCIDDQATFSENTHPDLLATKMQRDMDIDMKMDTKLIDLEFNLENKVLSTFDAKFDQKMAQVDIVSFLKKKVSDFNLT